MLLGGRGNYFQGFGEITALFSGTKGAPPLGDLQFIFPETGNEFDRLARK